MVMLIMNDNLTEDELDAIRIKLYEQTKDMSASEMTQYIKEQIAPTLEKYHIHKIKASKSTRANRLVGAGKEGAKRC